MKCHTKIFLFIVLDTRWSKINIVNPLNLFIDKINGYIEENNEDKYLALAPTNDNKDALKKYEELS